MPFKSLAANDIFISYARRDATTYANGLADELTKKNFSCFTDRLGTDAGEHLPPALLKELKNCRMLVVLCTEAAKKSFVGEEVKEYIAAKKTTRTIVPVIFDETAMKVEWYAPVKGIAAEFEDPQELVTGDPSQAVISRIEKSFNYSRSRERLRRYTIGAGVLLSVFLLSSVVAFLFARTQLNAAKEAQAETRSQTLSASSLSVLQVDPELSLLLALRAEEKPNPQSETALKRALIESHIRAALHGHTDTILDAEFSPDGKLIATASEDGTARVWDVSTGRLLKELKETTGANNEDDPPTVRVAKFSHDGKSLLVSGGDGMARIWETNTWQAKFSLRVSNGQVNSAMFSPDDKHILTGSDGLLRVWDIGTGQGLKDDNKFPGIINASFSADGRFIAVAGHAVSVIDAATWQPVAQFEEPRPFEEFGAALSPDGKFVLVTGSATPWLWEVGARRKVAELQGHTAPVQRAKFSVDGQFVLTVSEDSTARVWDTENWRSVLVLRGHKDMLFAAAFSPDGKSVVTGGEDKIARVWDLGVDQLQRTFRGHTGAVRRVEFSPDGQLALTAGDDQTARVWNLSTGQSMELKGHTQGISAASFSRDGSMIVTASKDTTARIWESRTGQTVREFKEHVRPLLDAEFSPDGKLVVTTGEDTYARVWDAATGRVLGELKHDNEVRRVEFSPDGKLIVTIDGIFAWLWDGHTYQKITELVLPKERTDGGMNVAKFSPDSSRIVAGTQGGRAGAWDSTGRFLFELKGPDQEAHTQYITSISFSKDGKLIVTTSADETGGVWDASSGRNLIKLRGPEGEFWNADFSPDGRFVVTANQDNTAWVWTTQSGQVVTQLKGSTGAIYVAKFGADNKHILTGSRDTRAYLFKCEVCDTRENLLSLARTRVTRPLTAEEEKAYLQ